MKTTHQVFLQDARAMSPLAAQSVDLVVTSPPYPMIEMWDGMFCAQNPAIAEALAAEHGDRAFECMHRDLDPVWDEVYRVLKPGGIACVNVGDATRRLGRDFRLYSNHSRMLQYLLRIGFSALPDILWRKQTNAPNKFMGSGMLPAGAYVTLEHEFILVLRKGARRAFGRQEEKAARRESAIFWEERNVWFSDVWTDLKGTGQQLGDAAARSRSAAYPFELAYRLVNMFSVKGDVVLDPFLGTGTTAAAAMAAGRNSVAYECDPDLLGAIRDTVAGIVSFANDCIRARLARHVDFVEHRIRAGQPVKHANAHYGFPVVTGQERELLLNELEGAAEVGETALEVSYAVEPPEPPRSGTGVNGPAPAAAPSQLPLFNSRRG